MFSRFTKKKKKIIKFDKGLQEGSATYRQDELNWRSIVFLPFNFVWRVILSITGLIFFNLILYEQIFVKVSYGHEEMKMVDNILRMITLLFAIDLVFSVLHKTWESVQKSMPYQPKSFTVIFIDLVSIIPIRYYLTKPFLSKTGDVNWLQIIGMNGCLRIYRIFVELINAQQRMGANPVFVSLIQHNAILLCLVSVFCSVWYTFGFVFHKNPRSWFHQLKDRMGIDENQPFEMLKFIFLYIYSRLTHGVVAGIRTENNYEALIMACLKYLGLLILIFMLTIMTESFRKCSTHFYKIKSHIGINLKCLQSDKHEEVKEYFTLFWKNWSCIQMCPLLQSFPLCLQKDVLTDIYWGAIIHSHVLRHFTINIQRQLSLVMESKFLQPGEHLFRKGELKSTYYYIATGVVQIMSHYDGVSPIMTISGGSCIGDLSLVLPLTSLSDVICASVCEVRFLTYKNFYDVLRVYPNSMKVLHAIGDEHFSHIKRMYAVSKALKEEDFIMKLYGVPQDDNLKWVKYRWRTLYNFELDPSQFSACNLRRILEQILPNDTTHSSKYLDLIVLSGEVTWQADKCCIKSTCSYVLEPDSNFLEVWLAFIFVIITIDSITVPYRAAFMTKTSERQIVWDHMICFAYGLDLYFQVITGVRAIERTIMEPTRLLRHHLKNPRILTEIIGTIPVREIARIIYDENKISPILALNRLFKLARALMFFKYRHGLIISNTFITIIMKYIYVYFFVTYIGTCFTFLVACPYDLDQNKLTCDKDSWFAVYYYTKMDFSEMGKALRRCFDLSLGYIFCNILKTGMKTVPSVGIEDIVVLTIFLFMANNLYVLIISEFTAMWIFKRERNLSCKEMIINLKDYLTHKNLHKGILFMLDSFISVQWQANKFIEGKIDMTPASEILSPIVKSEREKVILKYMNTVEIFSSLDEKNYAQICKSFRVFIVPENFIFCRSGDQPNSFNIIINGYCRTTSMLKEDVYACPTGKVIGPGQYFPLMEVAQNIPCLQNTVSLTVCEVAAIDVIELRSILYREHIVRSHISIATTFKITDVDVIKSKVKYLKKNEVKVPNFTRCIKNEKHLKTKAFYMQRLFQKYFILFWNSPYMIHPNGDFMLIWETIKVIQVIISVMYSTLAILLDCYGDLYLLYLPTALDIFSMIDVLVRFHVGNYNKDGILVHRWQHYLSHSFCTDFIASLPIHYFYYGNRNDIKHLITTLSKILQLYRISGYIQAIKNKYRIESLELFIFNVLINLILIGLVIVTTIFIYACDIDCSNGTVSQVVCSNESWITTNKKLQKSDDRLNPFYLFLFTINLIITIIVGSDQSAFTIFEHEIKFMAILGIFAFIFKVYFISKGIAYSVGSFLNFTRHRQRLGLYWWFVKNAGVSTELALPIAEHFELEYAKLRGIKMIEFINSLHPSLQSDLTFAMYYRSMLCLHKIVGEETYLMKHLTKKVDESYYQKNFVIIDINAITDVIYFILEGRVSVYNEDDECVKILGPGSMFGSFKSRSITKHKRKFVISVHTNLLHIKSNEFFVILKDYGKKYENKFLKSTKDKEYVVYITDGIGIQIKKDESPDKHKFSFFNKNTDWYRWTMFILSMVTPYVTVFAVLLYIISEDPKSPLLYVIYVTDVLSYLRILLPNFTTYVDEKTGTYVSDLSKIRKEYMKDPSGLLLDFVTCIPIELICYAMIQKWYKELTSNRLLRMIAMIKYILYHQDKIYVRPNLRYFEVFALVTLIPCIYVGTWRYIKCISIHSCKGDLNDGTIYFSLNEIATIMTFTPSFNLKTPSDHHECILVITFSLITFLLLPTMLGSFARTSGMGNYTKKQFEQNIQSMRLFLQLRDLSNSILESLWTYALTLWNSDRGALVPYYLKHAPTSMKCDLLNDLFGGHLRYNILFEECHNSFIVQLSGRLKRSVYFPGDFIIRKFDIDNRMYFINSGEVDTIEFGELNEEIVKEVHITGQCFGLEQGLYDRRAHMSTYKARSMVEMLTLEKNDWWDLAKAFPEEEKKIYDMAEAIDFEAL